MWPRKMPKGVLRGQKKSKNLLFRNFLFLGHMGLKIGSIDSWGAQEFKSMLKFEIGQQTNKISIFLILRYFGPPDHFQTVVRNWVTKPLRLQKSRTLQNLPKSIDFSWLLNVFKDGESTTWSGREFQTSITRTAKLYLRTSSLNLGRNSFFEFWASDRVSRVPWEYWKKSSKIRPFFRCTMLYVIIISNRILRNSRRSSSSTLSLSR